MDDLASFRKFFRIAAIGSTVFSALLTFWFGLHQHPNMGLALAVAGFLVLCSIGSDYVILFVRDAWEKRAFGLVGMGVAGMFVVCTLNLISNLGSIGWQRDVTRNDAMIQNTKHDDARDQVSEGKASLEMWTKRLAKLEAENAWAATVTADALRARLASANLAIDLEAKRGGCKAKCLDRTKERDEIASRIAIAEETGTLRKQIEATKAVLAKHREHAADTKATVAAPDAQAGFFAGVFTASLAPTEDAKKWTDKGIAGMIALGLFFAPMVFGLFGFRTASKRDDDPTASAPVTEPKPETIATIRDTRPEPRPVTRKDPTLNTLTIRQLQAIAA